MGVARRVLRAVRRDGGDRPRRRALVSDLRAVIDWQAAELIRLGAEIERLRAELAKSGDECRTLRAENAALQRELDNVRAYVAERWPHDA